MSPVVIVLPLKPAVSVALTVVAVEPAEAAKLTLDWPPATATLVGTVTDALLLDSETAIPAVGAIPLMATVQIAVAGPVTAPGVQPRLVT